MISTENKAVSKTEVVGTLTLIWEKKESQRIAKTETGEEQRILLCDGWWGASADMWSGRNILRTECRGKINQIE